MRDNKKSFNCPFCSKQHALDLNQEKSYKDYYIGLMHIKDTGDILVYDGYNWVRPEKGNGYPKDNKVEIIYISNFATEKKGTKVNKGDYYWKHGHGFSGRWLQFDKDEELQYNGVYLKVINS